MAITHSIDLDRIASEIDLPPASVRRTLELLDDGNTVAFITRYRKDQTGGLDEEAIRRVQGGATRARQLVERKATILKAIEAQNKLSPVLRARIEAAQSLKQLDDLYLPYRAKKLTLAGIARQRGLEPLARAVLEPNGASLGLSEQAAAFIAPEKELHSLDDVLVGVRHLIAEHYSELADVRTRLRAVLERIGRLVTSRATAADRDAGEIRQPADAQAAMTIDELGRDVSSGKADSQRAANPSARERRRQRLEHALQDYFEFQEALSRIPPHRVLAINRGERAQLLRVKVVAEEAALYSTAWQGLIEPDHPHRLLLEECLRDALQRLILPSLEREVRREMTERAEEHAVRVFAKNLRGLFLQPPVRGRRVLAIDPGYKSGCKVVVLDEFGGVLRHDVVHVVSGEDKLAAARQQLAAWVAQLDVSVIAIGNGAACRDTERLVADVMAAELAGRRVEYVIVNEAGASVYSTSAVGREELPDLDAVFRGAISIGRRLLDPLSELVKIEPANIGVGMYQHDVKAKHLRESLDAVVQSCVNYVGVDLNSASPALLSYVSGLNQLTARRVYEYRQEHGPFRTREQLRQVPGIGNATFVQAAGFLRIPDGENPLDATWIHPESYEVAQRVLQSLGSSVSELTCREANVEAMCRELKIGEHALRDILSALCRPGRDPRDDLPPPLFRTGVLKLDDLQPGMELTGTVLNVVDFGVFVDIGISDSALVHISRLADRYIRDPHEVVGIGDTLRVWVVAVDRERRRVSLSALPPGTVSQVRSRQQPPAKSQPPQSLPRRTQQLTPPAQRRTRPAKVARSQPADKPKRPAKPITTAMVQGAEPMRSFSDLLQYYAVKRQTDSEDQRNEAAS